MMDTVTFQDPAWHLTFPHRVSPRPEEWLASLILRCDEINHWPGGTTIASLLRTLHPDAHSADRLNIVTPLLVHLECLSQALAIPVSTLLTTTYVNEMDRLASKRFAHPLIRQAHTFQLSLCPQCFGESGTLPRSFLLPHITACLKHHLLLQQTCRCGTALRLFSSQTRPFTCFSCGLYWSYLPCASASPEDILQSQHLFSCYDFFFTHGTPNLVSDMLTLLAEYDQKLSPANSTKYTGSVRPIIGKRFVLGDMVSSMVRLGITPHEILTRSGHVTEGISIIG